MHPVLVVTSDKRLRERVGHVLSAHGWSARFCIDGATAMEIATTELIEAIVAEPALADISGVQLFRLLEGEPAMAQVLLVLVTAPTDARSRLFLSASCPRAHVVHSPEHELPALLDRFRRSASLRPPPPLRPVSRELLTHRLSQALDDALFDAVVAAEVRSLAEAEGYEDFFAGFDALLRRLLAPQWVALLSVHPAPTMFLGAPASDRARAEAEARTALGISSDVPCGVFRPSAEAIPRDPSVAVEVPVFSGAKQCGQLAMALPDWSHTHPVRRLVDLIASELGSPWRIVSLLEDARHNAATDVLTGLMNRRALLEQMSREGNRSQRYGLPMTILILDIDLFKRINDRYGHFAGDRVIQTVAVTAARALRQCDYIARWGGEEFLIALPSTDTVGALATAERVRRAVHEATTLADDGTALQVTVSIGASSSDIPWRFEELAGAADGALLAAKARGRNCVASMPAPPARASDRAIRPDPLESNESEPLPQ